MKKFLTLLAAMLAVLFLFGCEKAESSSSTKASSSSTVLSSSVGTDDNTDENDNKKDTLAVVMTEEVAECYGELNCGEYLGNEFDGTYELSDYYCIIKSYEELCEKTEKGFEYSEELFSDSYVFVIKRNYYYSKNPSDLIGYRDITFTVGIVAIKRYCWEADYLESNYVDSTELIYLRVPKEDIDQYDVEKHEQLKERLDIEELPDIDYPMPTTGTISIRRVCVDIYDTAYCHTKNELGYENGTAWLLEPSELEGFLEEHNLSIAWNRTCDCECEFYYCSTKYKILVVYREDMGTGNRFYDRPIGYRNAEISEGCIYITREDKVTTEEASNVKTFEFVAIPKADLEGLENGVTKVSINNIESILAQSKRNEVKLTNMAKVQEKSNDYYVFLDLGAYYKYDLLPDGNAYHIITDYSELLDSVEKPFITKKEFGDNYIVVMKIEQYEELKSGNTVYGIKDLTVNEKGNLCATLDIGKGDGEKLTEEAANDIVYILVPREDLTCDGKTLGKMTLEVVDDSSSLAGYFVSKESYKALDQVWVVYNSTSKSAIEEITKLNLDQYVQDIKQGQLLLVYYGRLGKNTIFKDFYIDGENMYIDIVLDPSSAKIKGYHIIKIDNCPIDYGKEQAYTLNVTKYEREKAAIRTEEERNVLLDTFYVSDHTEHYRLTVIPEFAWIVAESKEELENLMKWHTNTSVESVFPSVNFESSCVLAYYVVESCIYCHHASDFRKPQYDNGCLTINQCIPAHDCNETVVPCLYFIVIPRDYLDGEITDIMIVKCES